MKHTQRIKEIKVRLPESAALDLQREAAQHGRRLGPYTRHLLNLHITRKSVIERRR